VVGYLLSFLIMSLIVGGLARLIVRGPNRIGLWKTLGVGVIGVVVGGLLGGLLGIGVFSLIFEVAISGGLVYLASGRRPRLTAGRGRQ
jgi:uncharacterized membrane protein YeaQ/YmgE (transglycosylase-associated protein family)